MLIEIPFQVLFTESILYCGDHGAGCRVRRKGFWDLLKSWFGPALCVHVCGLFVCEVKG